jgi:hypothetical protein
VLTEMLIDGDLMVQMGFRDDEQDNRITMAVMCGREWPVEKHPETDFQGIEDIPLDF